MADHPCIFIDPNKFIKIFEYFVYIKSMIIQLQKELCRLCLLCLPLYNQKMFQMFIKLGTTVYCIMLFDSRQ